MLGRSEEQFNFSDYWLLGRIPKTSYWHKLRTWALNNLTDEMFQPLFSYYGRPSVSPVYTFTGILIQLEKGYSDAEFEEESTFDDRIKYAMTAPRDFEGIDAVTLHDHRARFFKSEVGIKVFLEVLELAKKEGMFSEGNLNVIDSFMVLGKSAKQDTYTMIYQGIKLVMRLARLGNSISVEGLAFLKRKDYDKDVKKPEVDWDDKEDKEKQLDLLVKDALALVDYIRRHGRVTDGDLIGACDMLERIATQDVEKDDTGKYKMVDGTAKDRIISINEPEMRHGHKTSSKLRDGYKSEILTGGEKGDLVLGVKTDAANVKDGEHMSDLIDEVKETGIDVKKVYGDSSYGYYDEIERREKDGMEFCIKVRGASNRNGLFTKDDFNIDLKNCSIICPSGCKVLLDKKKLENRKRFTVKFPKESCSKCVLRGKCTSSSNGRIITIHEYEDRIQEQRKYQKTEEFKKDYSKRSNGERPIAHITAHGGRKSRYVGKDKTHFQILMASINQNIKVIMGYVFKRKLKTKGGVCPISS
jgi:hypothetical protein